MKLMHDISQRGSQPWERPGIVGRSGAAAAPDYYAPFRPIHNIFLKGNKICGFEINRETRVALHSGRFRNNEAEGRKPTAKKQSRVSA